MKIACLQFSPQVGDIDNNLNRADAVLSRANPQDLDLLVLPEMAFSGYNFKSLQHISPYLEPTAAGITSLWARTTALKYDCVVTVGYPEKVDLTPKWPTSPEYYNSAITVKADGETVANYRKSFLYYTDETWALEGPSGFFDGEIEGLGHVAQGICMDLNPYKFEAPWEDWEFAYHVLHNQANLVILSMAWITREDPRSYSRTPKEPDMDTLAYWLARLEPLIRAETEEELIVVFANRCGTENEAVYAGTSAVLGIQGGEVKVYGILGRGEKELLVVDTNKRPKAKLIADPKYASNEQSKQDPVFSNSRTNFVISNNSDTSSPTISTDTTKCTSPDPGKTQTAIADVITVEDSIPLVTIVDIKSSDNNFSEDRKCEGETVLGSLVSCIEPPQELSPTQIDSPASSIPKSSKSRTTSRNTSCTRYSEYKQPTLSSYDPAEGPKPDSPIPRRPESPKSRNTSRIGFRQYDQAALRSHDLTQDLDVSLVLSKVNSCPHFASWDLEHQLRTLSPQSRHLLPRPRSV